MVFFFYKTHINTTLLLNKIIKISRTVGSTVIVLPEHRVIGAQIITNSD